jgi:prolyl-tRNA synthetase
LAGQVTLVRRDDATKRAVPFVSTVAEVTATLAAAQNALLDGARRFREARTVEVRTLDEAAEAGQSGFAVLPWSAVGPDGERRLAESAVTVRCLLHADGRLAASEDENGLLAVCGRAY